MKKYKVQTALQKLFIVVFVFFTVCSVSAQELPKSWMPKWKVGDWWRVKATQGEPLGTHFYKYEIIEKENFKDGQGFIVKVTPEGHPEDAELFVVDKHLSVRKNFSSGKCGGTKKGFPCGGDEPFSMGFKEAYPFTRMGLFASFPLPAFPLVVGSTKFVPKLKGIPKFKNMKEKYIPYYVQQVRRFNGQELVAKGYILGGQFKPNGNYYEVTIIFNNGYSNKSEVENVQIWNTDTPYWVYLEDRGSKFWLLESSWKQK